MVLKTDNITRIFKCRHGPVMAIENISLEIREGEFVAITGPSGSGKSTLLTALGGMNRPDSGAVLWDSQSIYTWSSGERARWRGAEVGFVFQVFNLIPYLNVYENVRAGLTLSGRCMTDRESVDRILDELELSGKKKHSPTELSVGQRQCVALARALVKKPRIILADEPTGNLDRETGRSVMDLIGKQHSAGTTVVVITHDPEIARYAQRTVRMVKGRIEDS